jgi:hypothetical protein
MIMVRKTMKLQWELLSHVDGHNESFGGHNENYGGHSERYRGHDDTMRAIESWW